MNLDQMAKELTAAMQTPKKKTAPYDTAAEVRRIEGDTAWVHIPGGADETPVKMTINAKQGDTVQVRVSGGRAFMVGNATSPPTDDTRANQAAAAAARANQSAEAAKVAADSALSSAATASEAAAQAVADAATASSKADAASTAANAAQTSADQAAQAASAADTKATNAASAASAAQTSADQAASAASAADAKAAAAKTAADAAQASATAAGTAASNAQTSADAAQTSANTANRAASGALDSLATVQDVIGVLDWAKDNATYTLTTDTEIEPGKTYWTRSGSGTEADPYTYTPVANPSAASLSTYYEISGVDEAMADYINTHLALTDEGLFVMADGSAWKVKIANDGVYIIDPTNNPANQMTSGGNIIGYEEETHVEIDYHSMKLIDKEGNVYFHVSDLRGEDGLATITEVFYGDGTNNSFTVQFDVTQEVSATDASHSGNTVTRDGNTYTFSIAPNNTAKVTIIYKTTSSDAKAFTFGYRAEPPVSSGIIGAYSFVEGEWGTASGRASHCEGYINRAEGYASHAEGRDCVASGECSHAEGLATDAIGDYSHAQNRGTVAGYDDQSAIGKYNDNQQKNAFEIGNGPSYTSRSNAFAVDWDGNVEAAGDITDGNGNVLSDKANTANTYTKTQTDALLSAKADSADVYTKTQTDTLLNDKADTSSLASVATSGNYNDLSNKPQINSVTLTGDKSSEDINVVDMTDPMLNLDTTATTGTDYELYQAITALGWESDVIV